MTGAQLRAARLRLGLTQQQLADTLDVDRTSVARWETGAQPLPRLVALALHGLARPRISTSTAIERSMGCPSRAAL